MIAKYISENTDYKVVLNGDGADEVEMGYQYFKYFPNYDEAHEENIKLLAEIDKFDVCRVDRNLAHHGLEARTPFLDKYFVRLYLSMPIEYRVPINGVEKYFIRQAFDTYDHHLLPDNILWRPKEAFSDGITTHKKSWFQHITEYIENLITDEEFSKAQLIYHNTPPTKEALYYRKIFDKYFPNQEHIIPHFWLPKWCGNITEPSARVLQQYKC